MIYTIAWVLLLEVVLAIILHSVHLSDLREIHKVDRRIQALMDEVRAPDQRQRPPRPYQNNADLRDWSRRPRKGPENAKYEGVNRERRHN